MFYFDFPIRKESRSPLSPEARSLVPLGCTKDDMDDFMDYHGEDSGNMTGDSFLTYLQRLVDAMRVERPEGKLYVIMDCPIMACHLVDSKTLKPRDDLAVLIARNGVCLTCLPHNSTAAGQPNGTAPDIAQVSDLWQAASV